MHITPFAAESFPRNGGQRCVDGLLSRAESWRHIDCSPPKGPVTKCWQVCLRRNVFGFCKPLFENIHIYIYWVGLSCLRFHCVLARCYCLCPTPPELSIKIIPHKRGPPVRVANKTVGDSTVDSRWKRTSPLSGVYRCLYRGLRPIAGYAMASLRQRSAALVAGGFWWILLADRRRSRRASRSESFFKIVAGTLALPGFLCARAIPFIVNEWTCRGGGGVRPHPSPTRALQRDNLSYRTTGSHKKKKTRFEFAGGRLAVVTYKLCCLCLFSTVVVAVKFVFMILSITT